MSKSGKPAASNRVTAVYLDGNTLMAASVSLDPGGRPRIHALRLIETEDLVERVDRIPHPIFMNTEHLVFPQQDILSQALGILLEGEEFQHPIVGVMPPDLADLWIDERACNNGEKRDRIGAGLKAVLDGNPYGYPKLFSYDLLTEKQANSPSSGHVRIWTCHFDDVLGLADQLLRHELPFAGVVTGQRALIEVVKDAAGTNPEHPLILIDIGKLRTTYVGVSEMPRIVTHAIPVGLARDDNRYFSSFVPTLQTLRALEKSHGSLLISPDYTPTGLFDTYPATPQMEVTRFASHVSEFATRLLTHMRQANSAPGNEVIALGGLPAASPGLHEYIETRTASAIRTFDEYAMRIWDSDDSEALARAHNHLPVIGGAIAFLRREQSRFGIVMRERRPQRFSASSSNIPDMDPETVYVMEWGGRG